MESCPSFSGATAAAAAAIPACGMFSGPSADSLATLEVTRLCVLALHASEHPLTRARLQKQLGVL